MTVSITTPHASSRLAALRPAARRLALLGLSRRRLAELTVADFYPSFFWLGVGTCLAWSAMIAVLAFDLVR